MTTTTAATDPRPNLGVTEQGEPQGRLAPHLILAGVVLLVGLAVALPASTASSRSKLDQSIDPGTYESCTIAEVQRSSGNGFVYDPFILIDTTCGKAVVFDEGREFVAVGNTVDLNIDSRKYAAVTLLKVGAP